MAKRFKELKLATGNWDGMWRVVIFDIPEVKKRERNVLRSKLKTLSFCKLQKSVFVCPHPCEKEINFVAKYLGISKYLDLIVTGSLGGREKELREFYNL